MIPLPGPNARANPYRGLSVQEVDFALHEAAVLAHLRGREVYRRTEFLALRHGADTALVAVHRASDEPLFSPVVEARYLAGPADVAWLESDDTDVGNATALAAAARASGRSATVYVVRGRYEHVNFLWEPAPVRVRVIEVVPPQPAKLYEQARQAIAFDADLPPIDLLLDAIELAELADANPAEGYLLPCRGSGAELGAPVAFLDTRPAQRGDWLLIGCERSLQFHRHFYGDEPPQVDLCPLRRVGVPGGTDAVLVKCCLLERGLEVRDGVATVPWGAELDEVRAALRQLTGVDRVTATPAARP